MKVSEYLRNCIVINPAGILAAASLTILSHRVAGIAALAIMAGGLAFAAWSKTSCFIDRHKKLAYIVAAGAWLIAAGRVGWFFDRAFQPV